MFISKSTLQALCRPLVEAKNKSKRSKRFPSSDSGLPGLEELEWIERKLVSGHDVSL